jgi:hypothetical protein
MLDVDYLLNPFVPAKPVIYRYRTGFFRTPIQNALFAMTATEGRTSDGCMPASLLSGAWVLSVFDPTPMVVCDWSVHDVPHLSDRQCEAILDTVLTRTDLRLALFVEEGSSLTKQAVWPRLVEASHVLEEPAINRDTLVPVLRYLEATTDLADKPDFLTQEGFIARFQRELANAHEGTLGLPALMRMFDDVVVTSTDPHTSHYDLAQHRCAISDLSRRTDVNACLQKLVIEKSTWDAVGLAAALDDRRWRSGQTRLGSVRELFRLTAEFLARLGKTASAHRTGTETRHAVDAVIWATMLLIAEQRLIPVPTQASYGASTSVDDLTSEWDRLARAFIAHVGAHRSTDPLQGLWPGLAQAFARAVRIPDDTMLPSRTKLMKSLEATLDGIHGQSRKPWMEQLAQLLSDAQLTKKLMLTAVPDRCAFEPDGAKGFDGILGHRNVVEALRKRVRTCDHSSNVLLYGPAGVGKRTLARAYAKAVTCNEPTADGGSCNSCHLCVEFDSGGGFGYGHVDVSAGDAMDRAHDLVEAAVSQSTLSKRLVLVVDNADRCPPPVFDVLLKTLEKPRPGVTFVLIGCDLRNIRLAGVSRCMVYRMRPGSYEEPSVQPAMARISETPS